MVTFSKLNNFYHSVKIMKKNRVVLILIVDEGRIVGICTERDLM